MQINCLLVQRFTAMGEIGRTKIYDYPYNSENDHMIVMDRNGSVYSADGVADDQYRTEKKDR